VREWGNQKKITGDVEGLESGLRSEDPVRRAAARGEFDEAAAKIRDGGKHHVDDFRKEFGNPPPKQAKETKPSRISTAEKAELEDSAELKRLLPSPDDRSKFMDWLKKGHREGDLGEDLPEGHRDVGKHEHFTPGKSELEAKVREWVESGKP
jgi:hypothetical protein